MTKIQKIIICFILSCYIFPQKQTWYSTRFEKFWYSKVHKMTFRTPFSFMPYNIKIGYFKYGGNKYWNQWDKVLSNSEVYNSNPIIFDGISSFDEISDPKNRTMLIAELDLLKYNFFKDKQNIIDVQFGLGYKFMKSINGFTHNAKFFKPEIQEYNINATFALQLHNKRYYTFYYSIGKAFADLYETNFNDIGGKGINQSFGLGFHFLKKRGNKQSLSHHGVELRFNIININDVNDPISNIKVFKAEQIGLMYSFGIGYGGTKTIGDDAYQDLLNDDFISSVEKFKNFQTVNNVKHRNRKIEEIISFGSEQIPYQMYDKAIEDYNKNYLEQALWWLNKAMPLSDDYLYKKIKQRKIIIIAELLKGDFNNKSINNQIDIINELKIYDENNTDLNYKLSSLLIKKANYYLKNDNFFDSYYLYKEAIILNPNNEVVVRIIFKDYITKVLNLAYNYLQNNDNVIAYEILSLISEFANESDITNALHNIAYDKIEDESLVLIRQRIQNILYGEKDSIDLGLSTVFLGQNYFIIADLLGHPIDKVTKRRFDNVYDFATFKIVNQNYKLFFKNKVLIDIERP